MSDKTDLLEHLKNDLTLLKTDDGLISLTPEQAEVLGAKDGAQRPSPGKRLFYKVPELTDAAPDTPADAPKADEADKKAPEAKK